MTPAERLFKLFEWGDANNIVVRISRFKQWPKNVKDPKKYYEITFLEVEHKTNAAHRTSVGKAETLDEALTKVWDDYKRKVHR